MNRSPKQAQIGVQNARVGDAQFAGPIEQVAPFLPALLHFRRPIVFSQGGQIGHITVVRPHDPADAFSARLEIPHQNHVPRARGRRHRLGANRRPRRFPELARDPHARSNRLSGCRRRTGSDRAKRGSRPNRPESHRKKNWCGFESRLAISTRINAAVMPPITSNRRLPKASS